MNTSTNRLDGLRSELERRGVVDVKFYFNKGSLSTLAPSQVADKVADFVQCYLNGDGKAVAAIGDAC